MAKQITIMIIAIIIFIRYYIGSRLSYCRRSKQDNVLIEAAKQNFEAVSSQVSEWQFDWSDHV